MRYARKTYHYRAPANCEGVLFDASCVPCLDDPATKGWLLHMLREATGKAIYVAQRVGHWVVYIAGVDTLLVTYLLPFAQEATEGEALAAALLAAWGDA